MRETPPEARLLVVEDDPNIVELLSASLRLPGFEVATVYDLTTSPGAWPTAAGPPTSPP